MVLELDIQNKYFIKSSLNKILKNKMDLELIVNMVKEHPYISLGIAAAGAFTYDLFRSYVNKKRELESLEDVVPKDTIYYVTEPIKISAKKTGSFIKNFYKNIREHIHILGPIKKAIDKSSKNYVKFKDHIKTKKFSYAFVGSILLSLGMFGYGFNRQYLNEEYMNSLKDIQKSSENFKNDSKNEKEFILYLKKIHLDIENNGVRSNEINILKNDIDNLESLSDRPDSLEYKHIKERYIEKTEYVYNHYDYLNHLMMMSSLFPIAPWIGISLRDKGNKK